MTREVIIRNEILKQYRSIRQFTIETEIPYSSLVTALDRGISGMSYDSVIKICGKLGLDPINFTKHTIENSSQLSAKEIRLLKYYSQMNIEGRTKLEDLAEDFSEMKKYQESI